MCCNNNQNQQCETTKINCTNRGSNYVIIIVLYILLAIILGSCFR